MIHYLHKRGNITYRTEKGNNRPCRKSGGTRGKAHNLRMAVGISNCLWEENTIKKNTFKTSALRPNVWGKEEDRYVKKKNISKA